MKSPETNLTFTVPLSYEAHQIAEQQLQRQYQPQRAKQAYLNSLAVYAVDYYLRCLGWQTDRQSSDSANPLLQQFLDCADLLIPGLGRLECRPVLPEQTTCDIPPEAWEDRIGYIAVQFDQSLRQAEILGFVQSPSEVVPLDQLTSLDDLLIYLDRLSSAQSASPARTLAELGQGLQELWAQGWQTLDMLHDQLIAVPQFAFRSSDSAQSSETPGDPKLASQSEISRGKLLTIGSNQEIQILLLVDVEPINNQELDILVKLCPISRQPHPLPELEVSIVDGAGQAVMQSKWWQIEPLHFEFSVMVGECFSIGIAGKDWNVIENVFV